MDTHRDGVEAQDADGGINAGPDEVRDNRREWTKPTLTEIKQEDTEGGPTSAHKESEVYYVGS